VAVKKTHVLAVGKQKDGIWRRSENVYMVRMLVDGKRQYINAGPDFRAAVLLAQEAKQRRFREKMTGNNSLVRDLFKRNSTLTLGEIIATYIEVRSPVLKPLTIRFYRGLIKHFQPLNQMMVADLSITRISKYIAELQKRNLSAKTINHVLTLARCACNFALKEQLIESNPLKNVDNLRVARHEPNPFSKDELAKIFANLDDHLLPYFILQASTGLRTGELFALRWRDIDFQNNQICVSKSRWRKIEDSTKTAGSERIVFIPEDIKVLLSDLQKRREAANDAPLVVNKSGEPYQVYLHKYWKKALKDAKVPYRPNYVLRSTYASLSLQHGADLGYISKSLGHGSIKVTADKYLRYIKDADKENKAKVTQMMADIPFTPKPKS
jgi:integrase